MPGPSYFPAKIHPREAQTGTGSCHRPRCPPALCPISCLAPQLHTSRGKSPWRSLPKIAAGFQLPMPGAGSPGLRQPRPPGTACPGLRQSVINSSCRPRSRLLWLVFGSNAHELLFAASPPAPRSLISEAPDVKMGANLTKPSVVLIFPPDFIILLHSFTVLSFPILIPMLENKSLPSAVKNAAYRSRLGEPGHGQPA